MPPFRAISRRELIRALRRLGFTGPVSGGRHQYMRRRSLTVIVPNPHRGDIGIPLLARVLRQAGVTREEWESV
jgi:predicted RNA binding protein YcfA (HicA-like mRNA interferase family)